MNGCDLEFGNWKKVWFWFCWVCDLRYEHCAAACLRRFGKFKGNSHRSGGHSFSASAGDDPESPTSRRHRRSRFLHNPCPHRHFLRRNLSSLLRTPPVTLLYFFFFQNFFLSLINLRMWAKFLFLLLIGLYTQLNLFVTRQTHSHQLWN